MKRWLLEKQNRPDRKTEWSLRDRKLGFLVEISLNRWMLPDVFNTCGGTQNIKFQDPEDYKKFSLLYQMGMIELENN